MKSSAADIEEDVDPILKRKPLKKRAKVLDWLERNEKAAAAGEVDGASDILGPGEEEKGREGKAAMLRKKQVEVKAKMTTELLRAGEKLTVLPGPEVELYDLPYIHLLNPHYLAVTICALLNSGGGHIYVGVEADRVIRGARINRAERDRTRQMLDVISRENIEPSISPADTDIEFLVVAGMKKDERVIKLTVSRVGTKIQYRVKAADGRGFKSGVYIRTSEGGSVHVEM